MSHIFRVWHKVKLHVLVNAAVSHPAPSCLFLHWQYHSLKGNIERWLIHITYIILFQCWCLSALQRSSNFSHSLSGVAHPANVPWHLLPSAWHIRVLWASMTHVKWCDALRCSWCVQHRFGHLPGKYSKKKSKKSLTDSENPNFR